MSFVKPGKRAREILFNQKIKEANLTNEEAIVILCGTNEIK